MKRIAPSITEHPEIKAITPSICWIVDLPFPPSFQDYGQYVGHIPPISDNLFLFNLKSHINFSTEKLILFKKQTPKKRKPKSILYCSRLINCKSLIGHLLDDRANKQFHLLAACLQLNPSLFIPHPFFVRLVESGILQSSAKKKTVTEKMKRNLMKRTRRKWNLALILWKRF